MWILVFIIFFVKNITVCRVCVLIEPLLLYMVIHKANSSSPTPPPPFTISSIEFFKFWLFKYLNIHRQLPTWGPYFKFLEISSTKGVFKMRTTPPFFYWKLFSRYFFLKMFVYLFQDVPIKYSFSVIKMSLCAKNNNPKYEISLILSYFLTSSDPITKSFFINLDPRIMYFLSLMRMMMMWNCY